MRSRVKFEKLEGVANPWQRYSLEDPCGEKLAGSIRDLIQEMVRIDATDEAMEKLSDSIEELLQEYRAYPPRRPVRGLGNQISEEDAYHYASFNPFRGLVNPLAPPIKLAIEGEKTVGEVIFGRAYEGPPGHVHGGYVAAVFDDLLACAQSISGTRGFTGTLEIQYRAPTPIQTLLRLEGEYQGTEGRKVYATGRILADGVLCAEARGTFITPTEKHYESIEKRRREVQS